MTARRIPIDAIALVVIAVGIFVTHRPLVMHGMTWNDSAWYFHFGNRLLDGAVPYRDYVFQVGPLPIYVDAGFQALLGESYSSSMYAAMFIKILRVLVVWMIVRRVAGLRPAVLFGFFCTFDSMFNGWAHHWSTQYAQLFFLACGLMILLATTAKSERRVLIYLACAGACAALVVSARQSTAITVAAVLFGGTLVLLARKEHFTIKRFIALWSGYAGGLVLVFGALAAAGALGPAIQQMFLDAPQKKNASGVTAVLDAISGGALVLWGVAWWKGFLFFIALPIATSALVLYAVTRRGSIASGSLAMLVMPVALIMGLLERDAWNLYFYDVPRTFLSFTTACAVLFPDRLRAWFGVEPVVALAIGGLPLASDWALEMSYPGRGWGDPLSLVPCTIIFILCSNRLTAQVKTGLTAVFATLALFHQAHYLYSDLNPFAKDEASDGTLGENRFEIDHPMLRGHKLPEQRKLIVEWLVRSIPPGSTCFMYGTIPIVYELVECKNPTRLDVTIPDFITKGDAEAALVALRANPPDFIIAQEGSWMNPPLEVELGDKVKYYSEINEQASRAMHVGLRAMLPDYESIGHSPDILGPELARRAAGYWDTLHALRIYRRKR